MTREPPFDIAWAPTALRNVARLSEQVTTAVVEFVYGTLAKSPHQVGLRLRFELEGMHSANRGEYRVIYQIDDRSRVVTVLAIDHRSKVYRRR